MPALTTATAAGRQRAFVAMLALAVAAVAAFFVALAVGSVRVDMASLWGAVRGNGDDAAGAIVRELRAPRALAAFATGGLLALAGTLMQVLLRNPLADPYVLGISGGAAVFALAAMAAGLTGWLGPAALLGAATSTLLVFGLARRPASRTTLSATRLLLTGVVVAAGWGALIALLLTLAPETETRGMLFWLLGDLSTAAAAGPAFAVLAASLAAALLLGRDLNVVARGDDSALALGVAVPQVVAATHALAAIATATAVATAGTIGFVGLLAPHALRLVVGNDPRVLLPAATLAGGTLLLLADTLARTVVAPLQLPVGVLTAIIGVPAFLYLLGRGGTT